MHLRRALLLFAIVLGLAAVAASVSRPHDANPGPRTDTAQTQTAERPGPQGQAAPGSVDVTFSVEHPRTRRIRAGSAATVVLEVPEAGQASIEGLGMTATAEPTTPASFDVLTRATGHYPVTFTPAGTSVSLSAGTLVVER